MQLPPKWNHYSSWPVRAYLRLDLNWTHFVGFPLQGPLSHTGLPTFCTSNKTGTGTPAPNVPAWNPSPGSRTCLIQVCMAKRPRTHWLLDEITITRHWSDTNHNRAISWLIKQWNLISQEISQHRCSAFDARFVNCIKRFKFSQSS